MEQKLCRLPKTRRRGFTLIELLVVIAIIGLLSSVVLASLNSARERARDAQRMSDLNQIRKLLELAYLDNNYYPGDWGCEESNCNGTYGWDPNGDLWKQIVDAGHASQLPVDPINEGAWYYQFEASSAGQDDDCDTISGTGKWDQSCTFTLRARLEGQDGAWYYNDVYGVGVR